MDYMDEYLNTFDYELDDDDFDEFEGDDFQTFDYYPDLAQRDQFGRDQFGPDQFQRERFGQGFYGPDRFRRVGNPIRRNVRCCVYRHRNSGRIRRVCQTRGRRCTNTLGRNWVLIDSFTTNNCNRCI